MKFDSPLEEKLYNSLPPSLKKQVKNKFPIGGYEADFCFPDLMLGVEVDGHDYHSSPDQKQHDAIRDRYFAKMGYTVLRYTGREVHSDVKKVVHEINWFVLNRTPTPNPTPTWAKWLFSR